MAFKTNNFPQNKNPIASKFTHEINPKVVYFICISKNVKPFFISDFGGANIEPITNPARDFLKFFLTP